MTGVFCCTIPLRLLVSELYLPQIIRVMVKAGKLKHLSPLVLSFLHTLWGIMKYYPLYNELNGLDLDTEDTNVDESRFNMDELYPNDKEETGEPVVIDRR